MEQIPTVIGWIVMLGCTVKALVPPAVSWVGYQIERLVIGWAEARDHFKAYQETKDEPIETIK